MEVGTQFHTLMEKLFQTEEARERAEHERDLWRTIAVKLLSIGTGLDAATILEQFPAPPIEIAEGVMADTAISNAVITWWIGLHVYAATVNAPLTQFERLALGTMRDRTEDVFIHQIIDKLTRGVVATMAPRNPMQPVVLDDAQRVVRFKSNAIVQYLLDNGGIDMNQLAMREFSQDDREQFLQLIGYSIGGYHEISYVSDESAMAASAAAERLQETLSGDR